MARGAKSKAGNGLVTRRELAPILDVNPQTVSKWIEQGLPCAKRGRGGRPSLFDPEQCKAWRAARDEKSGGASLNFMDERARKERAQALLAEQLYATRERALIPIEDARRLWAAEIGAARAVILASYTSAADAVYRAATLDGLAGVEHALKDLAFSVLRELSEGPKPAKQRKRKKVA